MNAVQIRFLYLASDLRASKSGRTIIGDIVAPCCPSLIAPVLSALDFRTVRWIYVSNVLLNSLFDIYANAYVVILEGIFVNL